MLSASKNLQHWCSQQCDGYPGVRISDLSSSFRDGLAFCALVHRQRPDLIDFGALSKDNVFENNRLAFDVAERELGIPALLDPDDMVSMTVPDRLSIMTYVSQYYNLFRNSNPAGTPQFNQTSPLQQGQSQVTQPQGSLDSTSTATRVSLISTCALCQQHVHLVQRCLVDGKLYHRQCFRCKECSSTLLPGSYRPGPETGTFICSHHHRLRPGTSSPESAEENSVKNTVKSPPKPRAPPKPPLPNKPQKESDTDSRPVPAPRRTSDVMPQPVPRARSGAGQSPARPTSLMNGEQQISSPPVPKPRGRQRSSEREEEGKRTKDPPWMSLVAANEPKKRAAPLPPSVAQNQDDAEKSSKGSEEEAQSLPQPKHPNPFEDEDEEQESDENSLKPSHPWYGITPTSSPKARKRLAPKVPNASPLARQSTGLASRLSYSEPPSGSPSPALSTESLPTEPSTKDHVSENVSKSSSEPTIHSPTTSGPSDVENTNFINHSTANSHDASNQSTNTSLSSLSELANTSEAQDSLSPGKMDSSSDSLHINPSQASPSPTVPCITTPISEAKQPNKPTCKENPFNRKPSPITSPTNKKSKKGTNTAHRPAPGHGFPLIKRKVQADDYIPEHEIQMEMEEIELRLDELERRGVELEHKLRRMEDEGEEDTLLVDWFKLIQEKHALVRRESELVYTTKQQDLEQRQADVEYELRCLLNKPEKDWLDEDKEREQVLMQELVTLIEQRNAIVKCLDEDKKREEEEDKLIEAMIQKKDFHADPQKKKKGKLKPMKVLKLLSPKDTKSKSPKDKKEKGGGAKR